MTAKHRPKQAAANPGSGSDGLEKAHAALKAAYDQIIIPGSWKGKIVSTSSITLGGTQQNDKHPHAIELSYAFWIAMIQPPKTTAELPVLVTAMTGRKDRFVYPASFHVDARSLMISLSTYVNRFQFSELIRFSDGKRLGAISFALEGQENAWRVKSWNIGISTA